MKIHIPHVPSCCRNCQHVTWLSANSPYFDMGECYQHFNAEDSNSEAVLLVSKDFGESCSYFEASEDAEEEYLVRQKGLASFLGLRVERDFPGTL